MKNFSAAYTKIREGILKSNKSNKMDKMNKMNEEKWEYCFRINYII